MKRGTLVTNSSYASRGDAYTKKCSNSGSIVNRCGWSSKYFISNGRLYIKSYAYYTAHYYNNYAQVFKKAIILTKMFKIDKHTHHIFLEMF